MHSIPQQILQSLAPGFKHLMQLTALAALLAGLCAPATAARKTKTEKPVKPPSSSIRIKDSKNHSGETAAERDKRLYRECRGKPNAGACLGYTTR